MRRVLALLALAAGCSHPSGARVDPTRLLAAGTQADMRALLDTSVGYGGLWFADRDCATEFAGAGMIEADRLDEFARCLSTLHLEASTLQHPYRDVVELTYAPGFAVEAELGDDGDHLRWIGYAGRHDARDALPAITPAALESLRVAGTATPALDDAAKARLASEQAQTSLAFSAAWLKVCLDAEGNVTGVHPRQVTSPIAGEVFMAGVADWKFKPFVVDGRGIPVCAMIAFADPATAIPDRERMTLPYPIPLDLGSVVVAPSALERVEGSAQVQPEDQEKTYIQQRGWHRVVAAFLFCIDEQGKVAGVRETKSTGIARYDAQLGNAILSWRYKPFVVEDKAMPVCSGVTFIYQQF